MSSGKESSKENLQEVREYHTSSHGIFFKVKKVLYSHRSRYQQIEVIENDYFGRVLLLDGLVQICERDEYFYHEMLVHPALVSHPEPRNILVIGGGDGGVLKEILSYPVQRVQHVEIDREVIEVSKKYFPWLRPAFKDKRVEFKIADGNEFVQKTSTKFDVILVDSSDPVGPSQSLHQQKFYKELKNCLRQDGVVVAQAGSPFYHLESIKEKDNFLRNIYKVVRFYISSVPTYPGGNWCFVYLSDEVNPLDLKRRPAPGLKYFNQDIHQAAFSLPNYFGKSRG